MKPETLLSKRTLTPTADPGQLPASKWLQTLKSFFKILINKFEDSWQSMDVPKIEHR